MSILLNCTIRFYNKHVYTWYKGHGRHIVTFLVYHVYKHDLAYSWGFKIKVFGHFTTDMDTIVTVIIFN